MAKQPIVVTHRCDACGIDSPDTQRIANINVAPDKFDALPFVCTDYRSCCARWADPRRAR